MIKLSNGYSFEYMASSGALSFDGKGWFWEKPFRLMGFFNSSLFAIVTKTLTRYPCHGNLRRHNPFGCIRFLPGGVVNAVGLTNPGTEWWCEKIGPRKSVPFICSIAGEPEELKEIAEMLSKFDLAGLEINVSCPNAARGLPADSAKIIKSCEAVGSASRFPVILKLSVAHDIKKIVSGVEDIVEAFSINSVPWSMVFPDRESPLAHLGGGGVSGKVAQPFTWKLVKELSVMSKIPVIGPGVWNFEDIAKLRSLGAGAISFGSIFLRYPWRPSLFVKKDKKERANNARTGCPRDS